MRKTLAYKICGYLGIILTILLILLYQIFSSPIDNGNGWQTLELMFGGLMLVTIEPIVTMIILALLIVFIIIAIKTKEKFANAKTQIVADIGFIFFCIIAITGLLFLPFAVTVMINL